MRIKLCGLTQQQDADAAAALGVQFCGFIFHPASPRRIAPDRADQLDTGNMLRVGVFVDQQAEEILEIMARARLDFAQLHGQQGIDCALAIGARRVIRTLWPDRHGVPLRAELQKYADSCAWYLLDAGLAGGGSGKPLEWTGLRGLQAPRPWMLAGGLDAENIQQALAQCAPDGVDFNSGVEYTPGKKNSGLLESAVALARAAKQPVERA
ncbi:MAG: N-(5'-phosphoribosyl)anthranilate isomerase [Candidatus Desulfovibrio kirbyi]|uniref:N-(5'-phosphoribosyl)anthranilate isomerase n=1 Tax=Candidatus Desulfovibrio kirbyi TaxID=2696086 RepID=A0A6L2R4H5_9BACT|nr:MAG: N-(5'-phosphoribosyl)anthranilate isomerase [Candidatus Desulfovibrio kirbyi]